MYKKYYDEKRLDTIYKLLTKRQLYDTLSEIQKYLEVYPKDFKAKIIYAYALTHLGLFDEASEVIENIDVDTHFSNNYYQIKLGRIVISLLSFQEKYQECYDYISKYRKELLPTYNSYMILIYLKTKLGILDSNDIKNASYTAKQIIEYDEKLALEHITDHHVIQSIDYEDFSSVQFYDNFDLEKIYYNLREKLPQDNRIYTDGFINLYLCKYDNCGLVDSVNTDYFRVCCIHDTSDIITMYPCEKINKMPYIDLNPVYEIETSKVKKISQIDKFNQRYGKNY